MRTSNSGSRYASGVSPCETARPSRDRRVCSQNSTPCVVLERGAARFVVAQTAARGCAARARRRGASLGFARPRLRSAAGGRASSGPRPARAGVGSRSDSLRGTTWHCGHVGHEARLALVEADQHAALLGDVTHRHPRAVAVLPRRAFDRRQHRSRAARGRCARALPRARAASRRSAATDARAAACSRRTRRSAGIAASTREALALRMVSARATAKLGFSRRTTASTRSPGSAPSTNVALPSTCATPRPSWSSDSMTTSATTAVWDALATRRCAQAQAARALASGKIAA